MYRIHTRSYLLSDIVYDRNSTFITELILPTNKVIRKCDCLSIFHVEIKEHTIGIYMIFCIGIDKVGTFTAQTKPWLATKQYLFIFRRCSLS